jgi:hypothetical protein
MLKCNSNELLHATFSQNLDKVLISYFHPTWNFTFLSRPSVESEGKKIKYDPSAGLVQTVESVIRQEIFLGRKIKYDPCAGLVQTVQSVIRQEIFLGRPFFVTTTIEGMNPAHGDNRGPSMVWVGGAS